MKAAKLGIYLLAGVSTLGIQGVAYAQDTSSDAQTEPVAPGDPIITVTGSRIIRDGGDSPSPVTVVQTDDLLTVLPGSNLADALSVLPVFAGQRGAGSNPSTGGSASGGNGAANQLNLRNLGITRTLVLQDGLRVPPTLFNGAVDVDIIPQMLVQRVDVVTGGASAVYGSDAVSGVVNYVLDRKFDGLKLEASAGISDYGDARQLDAGIAWGADLGDRTHVLASYQYHDGAGILRRSDRPFIYLAGITGLGTTASPYVNTLNLRQRNFTAGGLITTGPLTGQTFNSNGVLSPFQDGVNTGNPALQIGGNGATWDSSLLQPLESHQFFGRIDHELSDAVRVHAQIGGTMKTNENFAEYLQYNNVQLRSDNPFLTAGQRTALAAGGATFRLRKFLSDNGDRRQNSISDSNQWVANAGLDGDLGGFRWQLDYVYGRSRLKTEVRNNVNQQRLAAALDAVAGANGPVCYASTQAATASAYADCVALNPFGPTAESQAALDYIFGETHYSALTTMHDVSASIAGSPFELWAGPINVALSGEWRKVSFSAESDATSENLVNCVGLRYNCTATQTQYFLTLPAQAPISQTVKEVAAEIDVPLLRDSFVGDFNVNGAARYTSYNTSGNYWTWKLGFDWNLTDRLRFRGTWSRDIRAPTLYELFSERFVVNVNGTDRLTGLSPNVPSYNGGNPDLKAEIGKTLTAGVVWEPIDGLSVALDGYQIEVTDAILAVNGGEPVFQDACYASQGTSPYCELQVRSSGNFTDTSAGNVWGGVYNRLFNISEIKTWGADLEIGYRGALGSMPFNARFLGAYQPHLYFRQPNLPDRDQAGAAFGPVGFSATPTVRLVGFVSLEPSEGIKIDVMHRWRNALKIANEGIFAEGSNRLAPFATTNLNVAFEVDAGFGEGEVFFNVQNIFDNKAPFGGFTGNGTRAGLRDGYAIGDDVRGRYWTAGFKVKM